MASTSPNLLPSQAPCRTAQPRLHLGLKRGRRALLGMLLALAVLGPARAQGGEPSTPAGDASNPEAVKASVRELIRMRSRPHSAPSSATPPPAPPQQPPQPLQPPPRVERPPQRGTLYLAATYYTSGGVRYGVRRISMREEGSGKEWTQSWERYDSRRELPCSDATVGRRYTIRIKWQNKVGQTLTGEWSRTFTTPGQVETFWNP